MPHDASVWVLRIIWFSAFRAECLGDVQVRRWHYHTQHPLELTWVLQGTEPPDTTWAGALAEVELFFEWLIAHRYTGVKPTMVEGKSMNMS